MKSSVSFACFFRVSVFVLIIAQSLRYANFRLPSLLILFLLSSELAAQSDTVLAYDAREHRILRYYSVPFNGSKQSDNTGFSCGTESGFTELDLTKPVNTPAESGFTDIVPAHQLFRVTEYPVRTAVKLFAFKNDTMIQKCSGILVGKNLVLTALHCLCELDGPPFNNVYYDSLYAIPAYDNKMPQEGFGGSVGKKYYILKDGFKNFMGNDIAMVELDDPVGEKTGWIGIGYSNDEDFFKNSVFHKFSYPGVRHLEDTARIYNGDTLYYNYGTLDRITNDGLGYNLTGIPGQSGSTVFYTDNKVYYSLGVLNFSSCSMHKRIDQEIFYSFKGIIEAGTAETGEYQMAAVSDFRLFNAYPNPFNPATTISYYIPRPSHVDLKITDMLGREVTTLVNEEQNSGEYKVQFDARTLPSGVYIYTIQAGDYRASRKLMLVK